MPENSPMRYSAEEVQAILERALKKQGGSGGITHEELVETARELEISVEDLEAAIMEQADVSQLSTAREEWKLQRKRKFFDHLRAYLIVNAILFLINMVTGGAVWFYWPLFGWGIGLLFDAGDAFFPKEKDIERGAQRLLRKNQRRFRWHGETGQNGKGGGSPTTIKKSFVIDSKAGKIIIEKGDRRIEIG